MASFTTRVELKNNPSLEDYTFLHTAMESGGFSKTITSDEGIKFYLPSAEYDISGNFTRDEVLTKAKQVLTVIAKEGYVLVTESNGRTWNLKRVEL